MIAIRQFSHSRVILCKSLIKSTKLRETSKPFYITLRKTDACLLCGVQNVNNIHLASMFNNSMKNKKVIRPILKKEESIKIWKNMTVADLAKSTSRSIDDVFEAMVYTENTNQYDQKYSKLEDLKITQNIVKKLGKRSIIVADPKFTAENVREVEDIAKRPPANPKDLINRPPVVTIMGHVDHGKTTLLDSLRNTSVVKDEFGGITQHIGAFSVKMPNNESITFLDTPGHAAFSAMRARGAHATDIVVLVVAADDGVMEQTIESIRYAKEAKVPIIVAINKIDKPQINLEHTVKSLMMHGIVLEEVGGDVQAVKISALKGQNLEELIDAILALAEVIEVKGDPSGLVEGVVIESKSDPGRGKLATILVQRGKLKKGSYIVAGTVWAKVRSMFDEWGKTMQETSPGMPAQVIGWRELPGAGEDIFEVESERRAKEIVDLRLAKIAKEKEMDDQIHIKKKLDEHLVDYRIDLEKRKATGSLYKRRKYVQREKDAVDTDPRLSVIIKGDVDGSVEAILDIIETYQLHNQCRFDIIHYGIGHVTQNDIELAETFDGIIYAFNVKPVAGIGKLAQSKNVQIREFKVIYKMVDDFKEEISSKLPLAEKEESLGEATVLQEFMVTLGKKKVPVAGCRCRKGTLKKSAFFKIVRNEETIHQGPLISMKHMKNEVESIKNDVECGLMFEDSTVTFNPGDVIVCFELKKEHQKTKWNPGF